MKKSRNKSSTQPSVLLFHSQRSRHKHSTMGQHQTPCLSSFNPKVIRQGLVVCAVNLITFNTGYGIGLTSPLLGQLSGLYLDEDNFSWFASSLVIGQILGSLIGSTIANRLGRKKTCIIAAFFSSSGWALLAASQVI